MDIIGKEVLHKTLGVGTIISQEGKTLSVHFESKDTKFIYPDAFKQHLTFVDPEASTQMASELAAAEEEKKAAYTAKIATPIEVPVEKIRKYRRVEKPNIAFKCNYCDGGIKENDIGFYGVCSDAIIYNNIEVEHKTWCSAEECPCMQFMNGQISRQDLDDILANGDLICYESQMLREWKAMAGVVQNGDRKGQPMHLSSVQSNSLCVLTTREPYTTEEDRFIFAVFLVDQTYDGDDLDEGFVSTQSKYKIKLSTEQAHQMPFWRYHANEKQPEVAVWSSGLHRYINDEQAAQILRDIVEIKKGTEDEALAKEFYETFCTFTKINSESLSEPKGALCQ